MAPQGFIEPLEIDQPNRMALKLLKFRPNCHTTLVFTALLCVSIIAILLNLYLEPARFPVMISHPLGGASSDSSTFRSLMPREHNPVQSMGQGRTRTILSNNLLGKDPEGTVANGTLAEKAHDAARNEGTNLAVNGRPGSLGTMHAPQNSSIALVGNRTSDSSPHVQPIGNETIVAEAQDHVASSHDKENAQERAASSPDKDMLHGHNTINALVANRTMDSSGTVQKHDQSTVVVLLVNKTMVVMNATTTAQASEDMRTHTNVTKIPETVAEQVFVKDRTAESPANDELRRKNGTMVPAAVQKQSKQPFHDGESAEKKDGKNATSVQTTQEEETAAVRVPKEETRESYHKLQKSNQTTVVVPVANKPVDSSQDVQSPANVTKLSPPPFSLNSSAGGAIAELQGHITKLVADGKLGRIMNDEVSNDTRVSGGGAAGQPPERNAVVPEGGHQDSNTSSPRLVVPAQTLVAPAQAVQPPPSAVRNQPPFEFGHGIPPPVGTLEDYMISVNMSGDCVKGFECKFTFTTKLYYTAVALDREIMVLLDGPELLVADIENTLRYRSWCASFWPWAAGAYNVQIRSDCAGILMYASFPLVVLEPNIVAVGTGQRPASPWEKGKGGRWIRTPSGVYVWKTWEECDPDHARPRNWVRLLNARGIREINFVGDSHLRVLSQHLRTLIEGGFRLDQVGHHGDIFHTIVGENGTSLKLNFYWVDGIYANNEFGCANRGMFSGRANEFPTNISQTADVLISNSAAWTWAYCIQAKESYVKYFPEYVKWIKSALGPNTKWVWRTEAPFNGHDQGCSRRTNNGMRYANSLVREAAKQEGAMYFDAWNVEGPRFLDNCNLYDPHYSCPYTFFGVAKMWNPVGEAVVTDFMHFLIYHLKQ